MRKLVKLALGAGTALGLAGLAAPGAGAAQPGWGYGIPGGHNVVFVQTDNVAGNQIVAYDRAANGTLTQAGTYATEGLGGQLNGSVADHLGSQGSLAYDPAQGLLYAVNAGSNTVSVFSVQGDALSLRQVVGSGGVFPVSVAVHGNLVYVLNAQGGGSVQGFVSFWGKLLPLPATNRNLGLTIPTDTTQYTHTPGEVAFSPDGSQLIVTTKASGNSIDVFHVGPWGWLSPPVVNSEPGAVPFAVTFDSTGHLVVANAGTDSLTTYTLSPGGTVTPIDTLGTGAVATCWLTTAQGFLYAVNAGSNSVSGFTSSPSGSLSLLGATGTDPGPVDASSSAGGQYLYVQAGVNGNVDEFQVGSGGALTPIGSVLVPGAAGGEGIVAF
ncbi:MAG TPA: hypothetical protein VEG62_08675 [Acidimicrobiales bacterium]|nr:hypothetical protein [Acidimicrobiales bacterium]